MTNKTINKVPRELLDSLLTVIESNGYAADEVEVVDELRALLSAPSPANHVEDVRAMVKAQGVVMPTVDQAMRVVLREMGSSKHIRGTSNWCADVGRAVLDEVARLNAAQAIIDGLRGEVGAQRVKTCAALKARNDAHEERDRQAQRIGELEGLLREVHGWIDESARVYRHNSTSVMLYRLNAALSAGKEGE